MKKETRENILNAANLGLIWAAWLGWMLWAPHHMSLLLVGLITVIINLMFIQALSGVVHEAAHRHFIQGHKSLNEFLGNWFAAHMFLYGLASYRAGHYAHHRTKIFFIHEDGETAPNMAMKVDFSGFFQDIFGLTAARMFLFRTAKNAKPTNDTTSLSGSAWPKVIAQFVVLWSVVAYFGSPIMPVLYVFAMVTIYPFSNRIRLWGTHADIVNKNALFQSAVARNVKSPLWERVFFGNRMMMYHYEHHIMPQLSFRDCEKKAYERITNDINIEAPSYLFCVKRLFKTNRIANTLEPMLDVQKQF